jgi:hypothetical protein
MNKNRTIVVSPENVNTKHQLVGKKFNKLTVTALAGQNGHRHVMWDCVCDCGGATRVSTQALLNGTIKSCKCSRKLKLVKDITGLRSGNVVAVKMTDKRDAAGRVMWDCVCKCGNHKNFVVSELIRGSIRSCGCSPENIGPIFSKNRKRNHDISELMLLIYKGSKREAEERGYEFSIDFKTFAKKSLKPCYYCGAEASNSRTKKLKYENPVTLRYNGIDRVDNVDGYVKGNVVPCCDDCNTAKLQQDVAVFLLKVMRIFKYRTKLEPLKEIDFAPIKKNTLYSRKGQMVRMTSKKGCDLDESLVAKLPELLSLPCAYCGEVQATGLDRIDSSIGYLMDNVVPACSTCNKMKNDMTLTEFKAWTRRIYNKWKDFEFYKYFKSGST